MNIEQRTTFIKKTAQDLGFSFCGIAKARFLEEEAPKLENWLNLGYHAEMQYMENHFDKRLDPRKLVPGAKSVISLMYNYFPEKKQNPDAPQIAKYAYGRDYHKIVKKQLKTLILTLKEKFGDFEGRIFTDSAPVMERSWAEKAGIGWLGKNSLLINPKAGSFFFLAELICDLDLATDEPMKDYCGTCTKCIDACPTDAILGNQIIDAGKCISYFTIEYKGDSLPTEYKNKFDNWMFGCDICQDVCPWNRFSTPHKEERFTPKDEILNYSSKEWEEITEDVFNDIFAGSAVKRTKLEGLKRNIDFLLK